MLESLEVQPEEIRLTTRFAYVQLLVTGKLASGETIDATRMVEPTLSADIAAVSRSGLVRPKADGKATLDAERRRARRSRCPSTVLGLDSPVTRRLRPRRQPGPLAARLQRGDLPRLGPGQERLQALAPRLRPALRRPGADRRPRVAARQPGLARRQHDARKPTGAVPHVGGALIQPGEPYYEIIRSWIADGAKLDLTTPARDARSRSSPANPIVPADRRAGSSSASWRPTPTARSAT